MQGFDPKFRDFPDYIIGITREIWEDRGIATLRDYYADDIVVRSPASVVVGNQDVIAATMATLAEFPDRELLGEDVIWSGTPAAGMLSSHRILSRATHAGDGVYGPATGTSLTYRILADCHARENRIDDEWLIRDQGAIVRQMGTTPRDHAAQQIERAGGKAAVTPPLTPDTDRPGPYDGRGNDDVWGHRLEECLNRIMAADLRVIPERWDRATQVFYPGDVAPRTRGAADRFWMGLRAAFPEARFEVAHRIGCDDPMMPPRAAIRWSLWGRHSGWGAFGPPSGVMVYVLGCTHVEFGPFGPDGDWAIRREWTLLDETAIWTQILIGAG